VLFFPYPPDFSFTFIYIFHCFHGLCRYTAYFFQWPLAIPACQALPLLCISLSRGWASFFLMRLSPSLLPLLCCGWDVQCIFLFFFKPFDVLHPKPFEHLCKIDQDFCQSCIQIILGHFAAKRKIFIVSVISTHETHSLDK